VGAAVVTNGPRPVWLGASGVRFRTTEIHAVPALTGFAERETQRVASGDTTGCGDNFVGGFVAGVVDQVAAGAREIELATPARLAVGSGAFCLTHLGGTYFEPEVGAKRLEVERILREYADASEEKRR
jgi:sugar/nucleoside kinase (ribokinase family)